MALGAWLHLVNIVCNYIFPATLPARALTIDRREHLATTLLWSLLNIHDIQHPSPQCTLQSPFNRNAALSIVVSIMEVKTRSRFMYPQRKGAQYHKHTCKQSTHIFSKTGSREKEVIKETRQLVQVEEKNNKQTQFGIYAQYRLYPTAPRNVPQAHPHILPWWCDKQNRRHWRPTRPSTFKRESPFSKGHRRRETNRC